MTTRTVQRLRLLALMFGGAACSAEVSPTAPSLANPSAATGASTPLTSSEIGDSALPFHIRHPVLFPMNQGLVVFPPRNEPNTFFQNLQALYRDSLGRSRTAPTYVDPEGQNVWLTEYFRFYLNGCSHEEAASRTLTEIRTGGALPTCGSENLAFPPRNLPNDFQNRLEATYRDILGRPQSLSYVDGEGANVWLAQYLRFRVAGSCDHASAENKVFAEIRGGGVQPDCTPAPTGPITEVLNGSVSGGSPSCITGFGPQPCQVFPFTISGSGTLEALLTWSSGVNDLDLFLYRGATLIAHSIDVRNEERVSADVSAGAYQLRVSYYSGSTVQGFTLRVTRPR